MTLRPGHLCSIRRVLIKHTSVFGQKRPFGFKIKGFMRDSPSKEDRIFMAKWVGYGVAIGCGIGVIVGNTVLGIGPGVAIGIAIGMSILKSQR